ncbi:MAG: tetratricopeptide repeat protein [Thermodesulfobacteriota bacterium]
MRRRSARASNAGRRARARSVPAPASGDGPGACAAAPSRTTAAAPGAAPEAPEARARARLRDVLLALLLASAVVLAYAGTRTHGFVNFDDPEYVYDNPPVTAGLTLDGVRWALTAVHSANWHPLTWLSHMLDCHLFGLDAGWHHVTNVALHALATVCLFGALRAMTLSPWRSAFVAALFALHPRNVESVAWISERKDVLSAACWTSAMWAYAAYARRATVARYAAVAALFVLGLLAKPMVVTLPAALLLLDLWPLGRARGAEPGAGSAATLRAWRPLVVEKLPLFALALASSIVTFEAQRRSGAVASLDVLPAVVRLQNAAVVYVEYLRSLAWPTGLAAFYPYRTAFPPGEVAGSVAVLLAISALAVRLRRTHPYVLVGWLWYLGTLVPVIGIVRAGEQAMADRFTYLPAIGVFVALTWAVADALARRPAARRVLAPVACALLVACALATRAQAAYWRDSVSLFEQALRTTQRNYLAHTNLAAALLERGDAAAALEHASAAAELRPDDPKILATRAAALAAAGRIDEADAAYAHALRADPGSPLALLGRGVVLAERQRWAEAEAAYRTLLAHEPGHAKAHAGLAFVLAAQDRREEAIAQYRAAIAADDRLVAAHNGLALALEASGRSDEALAAWGHGLRIAPDERRLRYNRASALASRGRLVEALQDARLAGDPALLQAIEQRLAAQDAVAPAGDDGAESERRTR